ncbi:MAG: hypothetical protein CSA65_05590 [Proteobacteria bacterium]|nr:MAG: hypothetical protein CSA65_05590 [Pseudomonadota bacterium]
MRAVIWRTAGLGLTMALLAGCLQGGATTARPTPVAATVTGPEADRIDAIFERAGCRMSTTDVAVAFGDSARDLDVPLEKMLLSGEMTLTMANPAAIITSHRGTCR